MNNIARLPLSALTLLLAGAWTAAAQTIPPPEWRVETIAGTEKALVWQTESGMSYDLWAGSLQGWVPLDGYPREGTGGEMRHFFRTGSHGFFRWRIQPVRVPELFTRVPAGSFVMGNQVTPSSSGDSNELPLHSVQTPAYYIGIYEVLKSQWDEVVQWSQAGAKGYSWTGGQGKAPSHPVHSVSWFDAVKWCNARSEKEGLTPCYTVGGQVYRTGQSVPNCDWTASGYRLPTEAEWEKAARGGQYGRHFPWGSTITHLEANYYSQASISYDVSATRGYHPDFNTGPNPLTSPYATFHANDYGLFDTVGNVREWCWDWYQADYYAASPSDFPTGPEGGSARCARGGDWGSSARACRSAARFYNIPSGTVFGFRLVRSVEPEGFAFVPEGEFQMGDQSSPAEGEADELPAHTVQVSGFYMGRTEVTKAEWDRVRMKALTRGYSDMPAGEAATAQHPVHSIDWLAMVKWCNARSEMDGLTPCYTVSGTIFRSGTVTPVCDWSASGYRLPTEAEWEKAARGGIIAWSFPWGFTISHTQANYTSNAAYAYDVSPTRGLHPAYSAADPYAAPAGSFAANRLGIFDTAGNAWERCWDVYAPYSGALQNDPTGPATGTNRVIRGGAAGSTAPHCRTANRGYLAQDDPERSISFRLARRAR